MYNLQDSFLTDSALMIRLIELTSLPIAQARMIVRDFNIDIAADRRFAAEEDLALRHGLMLVLGELQRQHEDIVALLSILRLDRARESDLRSLKSALIAHCDFEAEVTAGVAA
jgi:hypothetical protein